MMRTRLIAVPLVLTAVLGGVAACGGKSDGSNSAACKKLLADSKSLDGATPPTDLPSAATYLSNFSSKLKADAASGNDQLKSAVKAVTDKFDKAASDASSGNASAVESDLSNLDDVGSQLDKACPQEAGDDSSS